MSGLKIGMGTWQVFSRPRICQGMNSFQFVRFKGTSSVIKPPKSVIPPKGTFSWRSSRTVRIGASFIAGALTFEILYNTNDSFAIGMRHSKLAFKRIYTVTVASSRCFSHYRKVLSKQYDTEADRQDALSECHSKCAEITRKALEKNAGIFIKLGQHIAALTYLFPPEWTNAMIPLQDRCPVSPLESIEEMIEKDIGTPFDEIFSSFDPNPIGTASLAQVHRATLRSSGQQVAVKVQHPSLQEFVPLDILMTRTVFAVIDFFFPDYPLKWLGDEMQESVLVELDFRKEAENSKRTQNYFRDYYDVTALRIPDTIWAYKRILALEYLTGARPDDVAFLDANNISRNEVSACLSHTFNNMIFTPGVGLHCDPHPGNIAIRLIPDNQKKRSKHNFEIILYDHGLYRDVPTDIRRAYAHFWLALIDKNEKDIKKYAYEFAGITDEKFALFTAAITGRDFKNATQNVVSKRSREEETLMVSSIGTEGLLSDIMVLLQELPRVVLLILKTNDLTRYLDEKLEAPLGPERTFLIMATYCARTVFEEGREHILRTYNRGWSLSRSWAEFINWWQYFRRQGQLKVYEWGITVKSVYK